MGNFNQLFNAISHDSELSSLQLLQSCKVFRSAKVEWYSFKRISRAGRGLMKKENFDWWFSCRQQRWFNAIITTSILQSSNEHNWKIMQNWMNSHSERILFCMRTHCFLLYLISYFIHSITLFHLWIVRSLCHWRNCFHFHVQITCESFIHNFRSICQIIMQNCRKKQPYYLSVTLNKIKHLHNLSLHFQLFVHHHNSNDRFLSLYRSICLFHFYMKTVWTDFKWIFERNNVWKKNYRQPVWCFLNQLQKCELDQNIIIVSN